jgi:hypothetical protein
MTSTRKASGGGQAAIGGHRRGSAAAPCPCSWLPLAAIGLMESAHGLGWSPGLTPPRTAGSSRPGGRGGGQIMRDH